MEGFESAIASYISASTPGVGIDAAVEQFPREPHQAAAHRVRRVVGHVDREASGPEHPNQNGLAGNRDPVPPSR